MSYLVQSQRNALRKYKRRKKQHIFRCVLFKVKMHFTCAHAKYTRQAVKQKCDTNEYLGNFLMSTYNYCQIVGHMNNMY